MVTRYGMDPELGFVVYEEKQTTFLQQQVQGPSGCHVSDSTAQQIDASIRRIIGECFTMSCDILEKNREHLERCAVKLLQQETLLEKELAELTLDMVRLKALDREEEASTD